MSTTPIPDTASLLGARVRLPQHVVYRKFPTETVLLNLQTGRYHGLNPTAGNMLEELERAASVRDAAAAIAVRYDQLPADVAEDVSELCRLLLERGLLTFAEQPG
jgi:hypothetical protein